MTTHFIKCSFFHPQTSKKCVVIPTQIKPNLLFLQGEAKRHCCFSNPIKDSSSWQNTKRRNDPFSFAEGWRGQEGSLNQPIRLPCWGCCKALDCGCQRPPNTHLSCPLNDHVLHQSSPPQRSLRSNSAPAGSMQYNNGVILQISFVSPGSNKEIYREKWIPSC